MTPILAEAKTIEWLLIIAVWIFISLRKRKKQQEEKAAQAAKAAKAMLRPSGLTAREYNLTEGEPVAAAVSRPLSTQPVDRPPSIKNLDENQTAWESDIKGFTNTPPRKESAYDFHIQGRDTEGQREVPFVIDDRLQSHFRENLGLRGDSFSVVGTESEEEREIYDAVPIRRKPMIPPLTRDVLKQFVVMQEVLSEPLSKRKRYRREL